MTSASKARGTAWETGLVKYLREDGLDADRLRQTGKNDEGDIALRVDSGRFILEAKNTARMNLAGWIGEAQVEAENYAKHRGLDVPPGFVVAYKRRNHSTGQSYIITTLEEWLRQIR
jgi:hypothetical protein